MKRVAPTRALVYAEEQLQDETFPDIGSMNDQELKELIQGGDLQRLSETLAGRGEPPTKPPT